MLIINLLKLCKSENVSLFPDPGVIESPVDDFNYSPGVFNDQIGIQNVIVKNDKLIMRSTIDESSMVRWEKPVPVDNWSFTFNFNELNLESRETAGLYMFYTKEKQFVGNFKGGNSVFNGVMLGIEFNGKSVDLNYAINDGKDFKHMGEFVTKIDSLNPKRFKNIHNLKLKIIITNKNIKIEIYDNERVLYDNFRFFGPEDLKLCKKGYYLALFADYKNVSSGKAFELKSANLNQREENSEYSTGLVRMEQLKQAQITKEEILHPNVEVNELIYKLNGVTNFTKQMLGELPETVISDVERELLKEIDSINSKLEKLSGLKSKKKETSNFISNLNILDLKLKGLEKQILEVDYLVEQVKDRQNKKFSIFETVAICTCMSVALILGLKEIKTVFNSQKKK